MQVINSVTESPYPNVLYLKGKKYISTSHISCDACYSHHNVSLVHEDDVELLHCFPMWNFFQTLMYMTLWSLT